MNFKKLAFVFVAIAILIPSIVSIAAAANINISEVVIEKDGELLSIELNLYLQMKAADVDEIFDNDGNVITPSYITTSTGKTYKLNDYFNARAASSDGEVSSGLQILEDNAPTFAQSVSAVELRFIDGEFVRGSQEFKVIGIE